MTEVWGVFVQKVASSTSSAWAMVGILGWGGGRDSIPFVQASSR